MLMLVRPFVRNKNKNLNNSVNLGHIKRIEISTESGGHTGFKSRGHKQGSIKKIICDENKSHFVEKTKLFKSAVHVGGMLYNDKVLVC